MFNKARAEKIIRNLEKRYMRGFYYENSTEAVHEICKLINEDELVGLGGSETIIETGLIGELRKLKIMNIRYNTYCIVSFLIFDFKN